MILPEKLEIEPEATSLAQIFWEDAEVLPYTALFRPSAHIEEVFDVALADRLDAQAGLNILSVGSSIGAEADTILAYLRATAPEIGKVSLLGVDRNAAAVKAANRGQYRNILPFLEGTPAAERVPELKAFGFGLERRGDPGVYRIDSAGLRADADGVEFLVADMRRDDLKMAADVIVCNNVLYHLSPEDAERLVWNMVNHLATGGFLSFGTNSEQRRMGNDSDTNYSQWKRTMGAKLASAGISPVLEGPADSVPFLFRRDQAA